ncbi:hypothetical protein RhiXN_05286 [Rhizoctonia solani]|uniref:Uncharacterized protein n=1 Tax=Rhizoctonia solani TaxID=456999 RepID=A0A8H8NP36_9AGAM|nr:uncharacterized protein RhiXN_05286 [Rhizoctonia solani]QRW17284.1 hypothetical protein RhiXN_05286 [Rhizoctonia solani]
MQLQAFLGGQASDAPSTYLRWTVDKDDRSFVSGGRLSKVNSYVIPQLAFFFFPSLCRFPQILIRDKGGKARNAGARPLYSHKPTSSSHSLFASNQIGFSSQPIPLQNLSGPPRTNNR